MIKIFWSELEDYPKNEKYIGLYDPDLPLMASEYQAICFNGNIVEYKHGKTYMNRLKWFM